MGSPHMPQMPHVMPMPKVHLPTLPGLGSRIKYQEAPYGRGGGADKAAKGKKWEDMTPAEIIAAARAILNEKGIGKYSQVASVLNKLIAIGTPEAIKVAVVGLSDLEPSIRELTAMKLAGLSDSVLRDIVARIVATSILPRERAAAALSVGHMPSPEYRNVLAGALTDKDSAVQIAAAEAIRRLGTTEAEIPALKSLLGSKLAGVRVAGVRALGVAGLPTLDLLMGLLKDNDPIIRAEAIRGIAAVAPDVFFQKTLPDDADKATPIRIGKLERLAGMWWANRDNKNLYDALLTIAKLYLKDNDWRVRVRAIKALRVIGTADVVDTLIGQIDTEIRNGGGRLLGDVLGGLKEITGQDFGGNIAAWRDWWKINKGSVVGAGANEAPSADAGNTIATPKLYNLPVTSKRIVLVLDGSGSVNWLNPDLYAQQLVALENFINSLPADTKVAVVIARDRYMKDGKPLGDRTWPDAPKTVLTEMTVGNKIALLSKVKARLAAIFQAKSGRMDLNEALEEAMAIPDTDTIVVISDGYPSAGRMVIPENILENIGIRNEYPSIRIDTITVNKAGTINDLMRKLAEQNNGQAVGR
jgi:HEAT repeat protein